MRVFLKSCVIFLLILGTFSVLRLLGIGIAIPRDVCSYVEHADYILDISSGCLKGKANFKLRAFNRGEFPILSSQVALTSIVVDGKENPVFEKDGFFVIPMKRRKESIIELEFTKRIKETEGKHKLELIVPRASENRIELSGIQGQHVVLNGFSFNEFESKDMLDSVSFNLPPTKKINIFWQRSKKGVKPARVFAKRYSLVEVKDKSMYYQTSCDYRIRDGETSSVSWLLTENCKEIKVEGAKIHFMEVEPQEKQKLVRVHLTSPVSGNFSIRLTYCVAIPKDKIGEILTARPVEVFNEDEYILIGSQEELQIVPLEETTLKPISPDEIPAQMVKLTEIPVFMAYHRVDRDARLSLAFIEYGQAEGVETAVDKAEYEVFFSPRGKEMVHAGFEVRNTHNQFMPVKLPEGAIVFSVRSMDRAITPLQLKDGVILIPLEKSIESFSGYVTFPIDICYILSEEMKTEQQISAVLPVLGVSISHLKWRLILPVDTKIKWKQIDADLVDQFTDEKVAHVLEYIRAVAGGEGERKIPPGMSYVPIDDEDSYLTDALDVVKEIGEGEKSRAMPVSESKIEKRFEKIDFEKLYKKVRAFSKKVVEVEKKKRKIRIKDKFYLPSMRKTEPEENKALDESDIKQKLSKSYSVEAQKAYRTGKLEKAQKDISRALESDVGEEGALQLGANVRRLQQMKEEGISLPSSQIASGAIFSREKSMEELESITEERQKLSRIQAQAETYMKKKTGLEIETHERAGAYYPIPSELAAAKAERTLLVRYNLLLVPETLSTETGRIFPNRAEPVSLEANADYKNWQNTDDFYLLNLENPRGYNRMNLDIVQENTLIDILNRSYGAGNIIASRAVRVSDKGVYRIPFLSFEGTRHIEVQPVIANEDYLDFHVTIPRLDSNGNLKGEETAVHIRRGQTAVLGGISGSVAAIGLENTGLVLTLNSDILEEMTPEEIENVYARHFMDISMPAGDVYKFEKFLVKPDEVLTITMEVLR